MGSAFDMACAPTDNKDASAVHDAEVHGIATGQVIIPIILFALASATLTPAAFAQPQQTSHEPGEKSSHRFPASDVAHHPLTAGRLGFPLGTALTIEGTWESEQQPKDIKSTRNLLTFVATRINGEQLDRPVKFESALISRMTGSTFKDPPRNAGEVWKVRAVEVGRSPIAAMDARKGLSAPSSPLVAAGSARIGSSTEIKYLALPAIRRRNASVATSSDDLRLHTAKLKQSVLEWSVLEAVLVDMINRRETPDGNGRGDETIIFWTRQPGKSVSASWLIDRETPPRELSETQFQRAIEAAKHAAWAQHEREFMESFRPKDERIVVLDDKRPDARHEVRIAAAGQVVRAHTPGFSKDKQCAIVQVQGEVTVHAEYETYVLERKDGKWVALARLLKLYP